MALFEIAHFSILWSNLIAWGYWDIFQFYGYVGPLECIFMAPLALFNEGVPGHFSPYGGTPDEAPKRKNVALFAFYNAYLWLCLKSHIFQYYGAI